MLQSYTAVIKEMDGWWVGWIEEVPGVNCQEATREALLETLAITLREALAWNRQDALAMVGVNYQEERICL
ncbi:MAG: type II toxin-antitoxin system HicB family antitoxin [Magnetococcales bacterium]|nr:type II toxin-antitoxin system HicB family antitoxin [Magnetococcales bacterium]